MIPVVYITGSANRTSLRKATAELDLCAVALGKEPCPDKRRIIIVIDVPVDETSSIFLCWAFAKRLSELAALHSFQIHVKVYSSAANTTLIAMMADRLEVKRGAPCHLSCGKVHAGAMSNERPTWLRGEAESHLRKCLEEISRMIDVKAPALTTFLAFDAGESICLGTTGISTRRVVAAYFGAGEMKSEAPEQAHPSIPVVLLRGEIGSENLARFKDEVEYHTANLNRETERAQILYLVIDSPGGTADTSAKLRTALMQLVAASRVSVEAKIYFAGSAAAAMTLVASYREIVSDGEFAFHTGCVNISAAKVMPATATLRAAGKEYAVEPRAFAGILGIQRVELNWIRDRAPGLPPEKMAALEQTTVLRLTPKECREYGIVHDILDRSLPEPHDETA